MKISASQTQRSRRCKWTSNRMKRSLPNRRTIPKRSKRKFVKSRPKMSRSGMKTCVLSSKQETLLISRLRLSRSRQKETTSNVWSLRLWEDHSPSKKDNRWVRAWLNSKKKSGKKQWQKINSLKNASKWRKKLIKPNKNLIVCKALVTIWQVNISKRLKSGRIKHQGKKKPASQTQLILCLLCIMLTLTSTTQWWKI